MARPTALVTGGSGGIGGACVRDLATDHDVAVHYHSDRDGAEAAADAAREAGAQAVLAQCDLSDPEAIEAMVDDVRDALGGIDVLVNNAAVFYKADLVETTRDRIDTTLAVNLAGTIYCTRAVLPGMIDRGGGRVVIVSSRAGTRGSGTDAAYGASKAGVIGFAKSLARQYTADGVFSNVVAPGATDTEMYAWERRPAARAASPIDRLVRPEEVADAVRFFATTGSISGRVLEVDGGKT